MTKDEFSIMKKRIREIDAVPEYLPSDEEIDSMLENIDQNLSYLFWLYTRYPRKTTKETEQLEKIRPLLKNIHVGKRRDKG